MLRQKSNRSVTRGAFALPVLALAGVFSSGMAERAEARPSLHTQTCAQARAIVGNAGAIVANTGPRTFERVVAARQFCLSDVPYVERLYIRTQDRNSCFVGFKCTSKRPFPFDD